MEEAWRYRPIQGANICPTCSIPHFPFCPQSLPLHRNLPPDHLHRLPFDHNPPPSHRPFFKQEPDNYPMPIPGTGPGPYSRPNPNPIPGNSFGLPDFSPSWSGGFFREELDERAYKKTRIGEMGSDSFPQMIPPGRSDYVSAERERRLSLIREHGGQQSIPPLDSPFGSGPILASNMRSGQSFEYDYRADRYLQGRSTQENRLEDKRMTGGDSQDYMVSDNFNPSVFDSAARARPTSNHPVHIDARDNYHDHFRSFPRSDNFQDDTLRGHGPGFDHQRNSNGFRSNVEWTPRNREESSAGTLYDSQDKKHPHAYNAQPDILSHALPSLGPRNVSMGVLNLVEPVRGSKEPLTRYGEEDYDLRQKTNWVGGSFLISEQGNQNQSDHFPQASHENIEAYDHQRLLAREYSSGTPGNQPQNTHTATRQATNAQQQERRSYMPTESCLPHPLLPQLLHTMHGSVGNMQEFSGRQVPMHEEFQRAAETRTLPPIEQSDTLRINKHRGYSTMPASRKMNFDTSSIGAMHPSPPLPQQHRPKDPPAPYPSNYQVPPSPPRTSSPLCPITTSSSAPMALPRPSAIHHLPEFQPSAQAHVYSKPPAHASNGFPPEASQFIRKALSNQYVEEGQPFLRKNSQPDKPKVIDAAHLFRQPHRGTRPDHIVIILRGLPGSGKSYLAKVLRDLEVENGGNAPRIHSMDDYFMAEVEKVEEVDNSKPSSLVKGKKRITKKVMEYCYEPEMEEAYRSSMLKAFKKTLEEGAFTFIIVDDRNLRVADFAQFWATAKRSGYEVYLLEASYKDPVGCAARNVHGFTADEIRKMAEQWEQAPPMYLQLDAQSFFRGDDLNDCGIQEVDMDMDDVSVDGSISDITDKNLNKSIETSLADNAPDDSLKPREQWATEGDESVEAVKELGRSKWSEDLDDDVDRTEGAKGNLSALSGLIKAYGKGQKSVRWGDEVGKSGFWIGATKKSNMSTLSIGPGAGYNLDSNPLLEEDNVDAIESNIGESKRRTTFLEQLRAERESFRAVFDRRRQRISGLETDDE